MSELLHVYFFGRLSIFLREGSVDVA